MKKEINYVDLLQFIMKHPNKRQALETVLYTKTQCIPNVLFKYYSLTDDDRLNSIKLRTLQNQQIYMSLSKDLNDPFDSKGYFYNPQRLMEIERLKVHEGKLIDDFSAFTRVASLTSCGVNSMPMWAHYSANHKGFCVSYDMNVRENAQLKACVFPVQYTEKRLDITELMKLQAEKMDRIIREHQAEGKREIVFDDLTLIFTTAFFVNLKHSSWSYEQEYRCTIGEKREGEPYLSAIPKAIYIGAKCEQQNVIKLINIAKELSIQAYMMILDDVSEEYALVPRLITA